MSALTDYPPLNDTERGRALCELADLYTAEQRSNDRPLTDALPALLDGLRDETVTTHNAIDLFARFARERAVSGSAAATYDEMTAAEGRAERLLRQLVDGPEAVGQ